MKPSTLVPTNTEQLIGPGIGADRGERCRLFALAKDNRERAFGRNRIAFATARRADEHWRRCLLNKRSEHGLRAATDALTTWSITVSPAPPRAINRRGRRVAFESASRGVCHQPAGPTRVALLATPPPTRDGHRHRASRPRLDAEQWCMPSPTEGP